MTNQQHPITPPPELVQQWWAKAINRPDADALFATSAAQWGADQELEACCDWLHWQNLATHQDLIPSLRSARRPKPSSLKEQALALLNKAEDPSWDINDFSIVRQALEQLSD